MQNGLPIRAAACSLCGSPEVRTDAVEESGGLLLAECPRCDHRWTQPSREALARAPMRVAAPAMRAEVANAA